MSKSQNQIQILAVKPKSIQSISQKTTDTFSPEIQNLIELGWIERVKEFDKDSKRYFNGSLKQFEKLETDTDGNVTVFTSEKLAYKDIVGLRFWDASKFEKYPLKSLPVAFSTHCVTKTSDDYIILRSRNIGDWSKSYDIQGGFLRLEDQNILERQQKFITDDLSIAIDSIKTLTPLYIYYYPAICEAQCLYIAQLSIDSATLQEMTHGKVKLRFCGNSKQDITNFGKIHTIHQPSKLALDLYFD